MLRALENIAHGTGDAAEWNPRNAGSNPAELNFLSCELNLLSA